jgi:hypothetical protein
MPSICTMGMSERESRASGRGDWVFCGWVKYNYRNCFSVFCVSEHVLRTFYYVLLFSVVIRMEGGCELVRRRYWERGRDNQSSLGGGGSVREVREKFE